MNPNNYGPFVNVVAISGAIVATFSVLLLKMLGRTTHWTWLVDDSPSFLVTAGARMLAVTLMATIYVTINSTNYRLFEIAAILCGVFGFLAVARFDHLRKLHVVKIPLVAVDGTQSLDAKGKPMFKSVVIGSEDELRTSAKADLETARKKQGGLSLVQFMSGYGAKKVNDPEALWDRELLAKKSNTLTMTLMCIVLFAVMAMFLAAFVIESASRSA
jgi:hypothetical protein